MSTTTLNGKPRKQLADQLDRLDGIIDALADGLNGAVADAARDGVRTAVKEVLVELFTDPEVVGLLRAALAPPAAPAAPPPPPVAAPGTPAPSKWAGVKAALRRAAAAVATEAWTVATKTAGLVRAAVAKLAVPARRLRDAGRTVRAAALEAPRVLRTAALVGVGVGAAVAVASALNHTLAATVAGAASGVVAAAAHAGWAARGLARRFRLA